MKRALRDPRSSFLLLFLFAFGLRALALLEVSDSLFQQVRIGDGALYDTWAKEIAGGGGSSESVLFQSPLYPFVLAGVYRLFGEGSNGIFWIQAFAGALATGLVFLTTRALFGHVAAWFAGILAALYAPAIWYDVLLHKTSLAFLLGTLLLYLAIVHRERRWSAALVGLGLGLLGLMRPNALLLAPLFLFWVAPRPRPRAARMVAFAVALVLPLAVLGLRNLSRGGTFLPVAGNAGVNFFQGNGADADGLYRPLLVGRAHPDFERIDARNLAEEARGRPLTQREVDRYWIERTLQEVRQDPGRWIGLLGRKARLTFQADEVMDALSIEAYAEHSHVIRWSDRIAWFGTLAPLAVLGLWSTRKRWSSLWILPSGLIVVAGSIIAFLVVGRLRMGLVPFLLPLAGAGALCLFCLPAASRGKRFGSVALLLLTAALVNWPSPVAGNPVSTAYSNLSSALLAEGRIEEATQTAGRAIEAEPNAAAHYNLAAAHGRAGSFEEARTNFLQAARLDPKLAADAHNRIGLLAAGAGRMQEARDAFRASVESDPQRASSHFNLGLASRRLGDLPAAMASYARATQLDPTAFEAHHNLGLLLEAEGRYVEAADRYGAALAASPDFLASHLRLSWLSAVCSAPKVHDPALALRTAEHAASLTGFDCEVADTLAAALAANGRFEEAIATIRRASNGSPDDRVRDQMDARRRLYEEGVPLRQKPGSPLPSPCIP